MGRTDSVSLWRMVSLIMLNVRQTAYAYDFVLRVSDEFILTQQCDLCLQMEYISACTIDICQTYFVISKTCTRHSHVYAIYDKYYQHAGLQKF